MGKQNGGSRPPTHPSTLAPSDWLQSFIPPYPATSSHRVNAHSNGKQAKRTRPPSPDSKRKKKREHSHSHSHTTDAATLSASSTQSRPPASVTPRPPTASTTPAPPTASTTPAPPHPDRPFPARVQRPPPAGLTYDNATAVLQDYVGSLRNNLAVHNVAYDVRQVNDTPPHLFTASLTLPFNSPVASAVGGGTHASKGAAKGSAAYVAVCELVCWGEMGSDLSLTPAHPAFNRRKEGTTAVATAHVGNSAYISGPKWWDESSPMSADSLFGSVLRIEIEGHPEVSRECRPLLFVTARPLPFGGAEFDISGATVRAVAKLSPSLPLSIRPKDLKYALAYSTLLFEAIAERPLALDVARYLVLPLKWDAEFTQPTLSRDVVSWGEVKDATKRPLEPLSYRDPDLLSRLDGRVVAGTTTGPRWAVREIKADLSASSLRPDGQPWWNVQIKGERKKHGYARDAVVNDKTQPLLEVVPDIPMSARVGGIVAAIGSDPSPTLVLPELVHLHAISLGTFRTASTLPAILVALDVQLLATELSTAHFHGRIKPHLARQAITAPSFRTAALVRDDYQRLELLGDAILKFALCVSLYATSSHSPGDKAWANQGHLTRDLHVAESNATLTKCAKAVGLEPYVRALSRNKDWMPRGWTVTEGSVPKAPTTQTLGDKTSADVVEALIAASFLSTTDSEQPRPTPASMQVVMDTLHTLRVPIKTRNWSDLHSLRLPADIAVSSAPLEVWGYTFGDPRKGRIALSLSRESEKQRIVFERYEFLGDAVLNYLSLLRLWEEYPGASHGSLTIAKHSSVSNGAFSAFLVSSGLIDQVTDDPFPKRTAKAVASYRRRQAEADASTSEEAVEYWYGIVIEKNLGDIVEALFGAILDDAAFDLAPVQRAFETHLLPFQRKYAAPPSDQALHPRSRFAMMLDKVNCHEMAVETQREDREGQVRRTVLVKVHGKEVGRGEGDSQQLAERRAFEAALARVKQTGVGRCSCARG